jgi:dihydroorotate dehydrogenase (NAD+) catalytic subunit
VNVPVIGEGGIMTAQDALEFIMAGASAVEVGTATFINPTATTDIVDGLESYMKENKVQKLSELIGTARR